MIKEIVEHFGGPSELARQLGVSAPAVSQWLKHGRIPPLRAVQIEVLSVGRFKAADILRGDDDE